MVNERKRNPDIYKKKGDDPLEESAESENAHVESEECTARDTEVPDWMKTQCTMSPLSVDADKLFENPFTHLRVY